MDGCRAGKWSGCSCHLLDFEVQAIDFRKKILPRCMGRLGVHVVLGAQALQSALGRYVYNSFPTGVPHVFFVQTFSQTSLGPGGQRWIDATVEGVHLTLIWSHDLRTANMTAMHYLAVNLKTFEHEMNPIANIDKLLLD